MLKESIRTKFLKRVVERNREKLPGKHPGFLTSRMLTPNSVSPNTSLVQETANEKPIREILEEFLDEASDANPTSLQSRIPCIKTALNESYTQKKEISLETISLFKTLMWQITTHDSQIRSTLKSARLALDRPEKNIESLVNELNFHTISEFKNTLKDSEPSITLCTVYFQIYYNSKDFEKSDKSVNLFKLQSISQILQNMKNSMNIIEKTPLKRDFSNDLLEIIPFLQDSSAKFIYEFFLSVCSLYTHNGLPELVVEEPCINFDQSIFAISNQKIEEINAVNSSTFTNFKDTIGKESQDSNALTKEQIIEKFRKFLMNKLKMNLKLNLFPNKQKFIKEFSNKLSWINQKEFNNAINDRTYREIAIKAQNEAKGCVQKSLPSSWRSQLMAKRKSLVTSKSKLL